MDNTEKKNTIKSENWVLYYTDDGIIIIISYMFKTLFINILIGIPYWHDHSTGESTWATKEGINLFLELLLVNNIILSSNRY